MSLRTARDSVRTAQERADGSGSGTNGAIVVGSWQEELIGFLQLNVDPSISTFPYVSSHNRYSLIAGVATIDDTLRANDSERLDAGLGTIAQVQAGQDGIMSLTSGVGGAGATSLFGPYGGVIGGGGGHVMAVDVAGARAWAVGARFQIRTVPDADTVIYCASLVGTLAAPDKFIAIRAVAGVPTLIYGINGIDTRSASLPFPTDKEQHEYICAYTPSGPNAVPWIGAFLDRVPVGSFEPTLGQVDLEPSVFRTRCQSTTAVNQLLYVDRTFCASNAP